MLKPYTVTYKQYPDPGEHTETVMGMDATEVRNTFDPHGHYTIVSVRQATKAEEISMQRRGLENG